MSAAKKQTIALTAILIVIMLTLIGIFTYDKLKTNGTIESKEIKSLMNDFNEAFNSKSGQIVYYASSSCSYCELETPVLETIAKDYDLKYLYIDSAKLGEKQRKYILEKLEITHATPTTVVVKNGKIVSTQVGYAAGVEYVEFFKNAGILSEDAVYSPEANITSINYSKYQELINNGETNIIVIGQTTCSHCIAIKPALNSVASQYGLVINYLNLTDMSEEENNNFTESLKTIEYNDPDFVAEGSFGTPLTLIVKNGKVTNYISGERTTSQLVREFKKFGLVS